MAVGAWLESSNAPQSGAAYAFTGFSAPGIKLSLAPDNSGGYFIRGNGIVGRNYQLLRATSVTDPWTTNATTTAVAPGLIEFHDTNAPPGRAFYRAVHL